MLLLLVLLLVLLLLVLLLVLLLHLLCCEHLGCAASRLACSSLAWLEIDAWLELDAQHGGSTIGLARRSARFDARLSSTLGSARRSLDSAAPSFGRLASWLGSAGLARLALLTRGTHCSAC